MNLTIRSKLALWYSLMLMLFLTAGFAGITVFVKQELIKQNRAIIIRDSAVLADNIEYSEYRERYEISLNDAEEESLSGGLLYALYNTDGEWISGRRSAWIDALTYNEDITETYNENVDWYKIDREAYNNGD